jgi:methylated-DNA-[protein]-cysteine S-methyltransferase
MASFADRLTTPIGELVVVASEQGVVRRLLFAGDQAELGRDASLRWDPGPCRRAVAQLQQYFDGTRQAFDLRLELEGTDFQLAVWQELRRIPFGTTISYGELAERVSTRQAVRAVGAANGANPIPIVIPCHRVLGADGSLVGFGGGLEVKRQLLLHEGVFLL